MKWFLAQTLLIQIVTFLLGLLVGYWLWRIRWRKIRSSSSATSSASQLAGGQSSDTQLQLDHLHAEHCASETARTQLEKSLSALKFEHGGLRTALAEREDQVKGLLLDVDRAKVSSSPADATKISTLSGEIDTHKTRVQGLLGEVDAHKQQTSKLNAELTTVRSQYESLQAAATAERETALAEARSHVAGQVTEDLTASLTKDITDRVRAESNAEHEAIMNARLASMKSDHEGLLSVRAEVGGLHDQLNSVRAELDSERASFTQQHSQLSSQSEAGIRRIDELEAEIGRLGQERAALDGQRGDLDAHLSASRNRIGEIEAEIGSVRASYDAEIGHARNRSEEAEAEAGRVREELARIHVELEGARSAEAESTSKMQGFSSSIEAHQNELTGLRAQLDAALEGGIEAESELGRVRSTLDEALTERERFRSDLAGADAELDRLREEIASRESHVAQLQVDLEGARSTHGELSAHVQGLSGQIETRDGELNAIKVSLEASRESGIEAEAELAQFRRQLAAMKEIGAETDRLRAELSASTTALQEANRNCESHDAQIHALQSDLSQLRTSHTGAEELMNSLRTEGERLRHELTAAQNETHSVRSHLAEESASHGVTQSRLGGFEQQIQGFASTIGDHEGTIASHESTIAERQAELGALRAELANSRNRTVDDLERIEGVGPAFSRALQGSGLRTFAAIRDADELILRGALDRANLKLAPSLPTWSRQAGYLAAGDQDGFAAYTEDLVAGQDPTTWTAGEENDPDSGVSAVTRAGEFEVDESGFARRSWNPRSGEGDYLQRIEGIGPKIDAALKTAGISTFVELANATDATLRLAIEAAGMTFAPSLVTWAGQSRYLANGDEAGFAAYTERLSAGRPEEA